MEKEVLVKLVVDVEKVHKGGLFAGKGVVVVKGEKTVVMIDGSIITFYENNLIPDIKFWEEGDDIWIPDGMKIYKGIEEDIYFIELNSKEHALLYLASPLEFILKGNELITLDKSAIKEEISDEKLLIIGG